MSSYSRSSSESSSSSAGSTRYSLDGHRPSQSRGSYTPTVEIMRCSRCAKSVETISSSGGAGGISTSDARASGMVKFGHNLYYCDRCAKMVGYQ